MLAPTFGPAGTTATISDGTTVFAALTGQTYAVTPAVTTTYTLTVVNTVGTSTSRALTVTVN